MRGVADIVTQKHKTCTTKATVEWGLKDTLAEQMLSKTARAFNKG